jgi:putative ABC transport system permease protein
MGVAYKQSIPEIATCVRVNEAAVIVRKGKDVFDENPLFADKDLFNTFSFPLLNGNPESVLNDPHSIVLTEETAQKYFGNTDVVGKTMEVKMHESFELFTVTGLAKASPQNSTIKFSMVIPFSYYMEGNKREGWIGVA